MGEVGAADLLLLTAVIGVGSLLQGAVGFGANLLTVPVMVLVDPDLVPGSALVAALVLNLLVARREAGSGDLGETAWALVGRVAGTVAGVLALGIVAGDDIGLWVGLALLASVAVSAGRWVIRPTTPVVVGAGAASGFMATTVAIGGPAIALVYQHAEGPVLRAQLARYLAVGTALSIVALAVSGHLDGVQAAVGVALIPGTVVGYVLSRPLAEVLDRGWTRVAVLALSAASAALVLTDWALAQ